MIVCLAQSQSIEILRLSLIRIEQGGGALAPLLTSNKSLKALTLDSCLSVIAEDHLAIFDALQSNCSIQELDLQLTYFHQSKDGLRNENVAKLAIEKLASNRSLKALTLPADHPGLLASLPKLLNEHVALECLDLNSLPFDRRTGPTLATALKGARNLKILKFSMSRFDFAKYRKTDTFDEIHTNFNTCLTEMLTLAPVLESLTIGFATTLEPVYKALISNSKITELHLEALMLEDDLEEQLSQLKDIVRVREAPLKFSAPKTYRMEAEMKFLNELTAFMNTNFDNYQRIPDVAATMTLAMPDLPMDIVLFQIKTMIRTLLPHEVKAVFDGLLSVKTRN